MRRIPQMLSYIQVDIDQQLETWKQEQANTNDPPIQAALESLKTKSTTVCHSLVITFLRSSYVTGSHAFKMALYENEPFITPPICHQLIDMSHRYADTTAGINRLAKKMNSKFSHVLSSEREEVRRWVMEQYYKESHFIFEKLFVQASSSDLAVPVYFGEEMGHVTQIGVMEP